MSSDWAAGRPPRGLARLSTRSGARWQEPLCKSHFAIGPDRWARKRAAASSVRTEQCELSSPGSNVRAVRLPFGHRRLANPHRRDACRLPVDERRFLAVPAMVCFTSSTRRAARSRWWNGPAPARPCMPKPSLDGLRRRPSSWLLDEVKMQVRAVVRKKLRRLMMAPVNLLNSIF
jgi:hypothetical protein